jgi:RHS repeat-associated protein
VQTWTVYDGGNPYADFNASGTLTARYLASGGLDTLMARMDNAGNVVWYLGDLLGSVRQVVSTAGAVQDQLAYDSFGNIVSETNAVGGDRFKYAGREWDANLGLYYYRARWYAPTAGRFLSEDPAGFGAGDANLYRYAGNDPTGFADPSGLAAGPPGIYWREASPGQSKIIAAAGGSSGVPGVSLGQPISAALRARLGRPYPVLGKEVTAFADIATAQWQNRVWSVPGKPAPADAPVPLPQIRMTSPPRLLPIPSLYSLAATRDKQKDGSLILSYREPTTDRLDALAVEHAIDTSKDPQVRGLKNNRALVHVSRQGATRLYYYLDSGEFGADVQSRARANRGQQEAWEAPE